MKLLKNLLLILRAMSLVFVTAIVALVACSHPPENAPFTNTPLPLAQTPWKESNVPVPAPNQCKVLDAAGLPVSLELRNSHIIYRAGRDVYRPDQIRVVNINDGSHRIVLENLPYPYYDIGLLEDSYRFVMVDDRKLWISDLTGATPRLIDSRSSDISTVLKNFSPNSRVRRVFNGYGSSVSPDGRWTATWNLGDPSLVIKDNQTSKRVDVIEYDNHGYIDGNWSPDGMQYAITYSKGFQGEISRVYIVNFDGTNLREITQYRSVDLGRPYWSPDGHKIVFTLRKYLESYPTYYQVLSLDTGDSRTFGVAAEESTAWRNGNDIIWSPDDQWILFFTQESSPNGLKIDIKTINTTTGEFYCVTNDDLVEVMADWR